MGNRANFLIEQPDGHLCVYGHWAGNGMLSQFASAIERVVEAGRQYYLPYANRIIISQLVGEGWAGDLGWGVSVNNICDNEHSIPVVSLGGGTVSLYPATYSYHDIDWDHPKFTMSINSFIERFL